MAKESAVVVRRDTSEKSVVKLSELAQSAARTLADIQKNLFDKAVAFRNDNTREVDDWDEFVKVIEEKGGFLMAHWCESADCEAKAKAETKATIRCIPFDQKKEKGECVVCGGKSGGRVVWAKAY